MNLPIKVGALVLLLMSMVVAISMADSKYVSEDFEITMRTGAGKDRKIIALIPSGREVEVVTPGDEWTEVRTANGKQGWVLTRYLTDELPTALVLERLRQKHANLISKNEELRKQASQLSAQNKQLSGDLNQTQKGLEKLNTAHETLKNESGAFLKLKAKYEKTLKALDQERTKAKKLDSNLTRLSTNEFTKGILYGGGFIILGFVVGWILKRPKRRSPLL